MGDQSSPPDPGRAGPSARGGWLEVAPTWRDRIQYGIALPVVTVGGAGLLAATVGPPPTLPAALAFYGALLVAVVSGVGFALTAWRARLIIGPSGVTVRAALRERTVDWSRLERLEVGRAHRYAGRHGRGPRWQALHVRVHGEQLPVVAAASNRPKRVMPALIDDVDRRLAGYGHRVHRRDR